MSKYLSVCILVIICWDGDSFRSVKADEGEGIEGLAETIVNPTVRDQLSG